MSFTALEGLDSDTFDIGGADYLNLNGVEATAGTDSVNNEEDYFASILKKLSKNYGFNPRTLLTTCVLSVGEKVKINSELQALYNDLNENKASCFITSLSGVDENTEFNNSFSTQPLFLCAINANYDPINSIYLTGAIAGGFVSFKVDEDERNNTEWSNIVLEDEIYQNQNGLSNTEANKIVENGYVCALQYMSEGTGLVVRGAENGWDIAMHSCYIQIVNLIPIKIGNLMLNRKNKTKSGDTKNAVILELKQFGKRLFNNNFLSNEPKENDTIYQALSDERKLEIDDIGWSPYIKPLNEIEGNQIPFEIAICLSSIMASFNGVYEISNN